MRVERVTGRTTDPAATTSRAGGASWAIWMVPVPGGQPLGDTIAVGADVALPAPLAFRAVTVTRSVCPTSVSVKL
jgi:hypothetical protein